MKTAQRLQLSPAKPELSAAIHAKCPKCRTGNMFANNIYSFEGQKMHTNCPHCGFRFETEPGYFYVAMFISYALNVALLVTLSVAVFTLTHSENPWLYITLLLSIAFILSPVNFRYSRVILLYWLTPNFHFDPKKADDNYKNPFTV